jgi:hypothetical protein
MSEPSTPPIAGWYPDPENATADRWWNGSSWSDQRRSRNTPAGWAPPTAGATSGTASGVPAIPVPPVAPAPAARPNPYAHPEQVQNPYSGAGMFQPATPGGPSTYASTPYAAVRGTPNRNPLALAGFITSMVAILFNWILFGAPGIVGGILSIAGLRRANGLVREGVVTGNGRGMAIGGIVAGFTGALLWDLFYFGVIASFSSYPGY